MKTVEIKVLNKSKHETPKKLKPGDSAFDVKADIDSPISLLPNNRVLIPTNLHFSIPDGYEIQVRSRSGLAIKYGIVVLNSPGTLDSGYIGSLGIILYNSSLESFLIEDGMRIAQIVICEVPSVTFTEVKRLDETERGENGFGHTGLY